MKNAQWIRACLAEEGVGFSRSRRVYAPSAKPRVYLKDGDRVFGPGPRESCQHLFAIRIVPEDVALIQQFDVCHTSCYSNIEYELPALAAACKVSSIFQTIEDRNIKESVSLPDLCLLFGADLELEACRELLTEACRLGTKIAGVTMRKDGAMFYDGTNFYSRASSLPMRWILWERRQLHRGIFDPV